MTRRRKRILISNRTLPLAGSILWTDATRLPLGTTQIWNDISGTNNNFIQNTLALRPICAPNQQAGKNGLVFSAASTKFMQTAAFAAPIAAPVTMFIVAKYTTATPSYILDGIATSNRNAVFNSSAGDRYSLYAGTQLDSASILNTSTHIHCCIFNTSSSLYFLDNTQISSGNAGSQSLTGLTLGSRFTGLTDFLNGVVFEILVYPFLLTPTQRNYNYNYLQTKWLV